MNLGLPIVDRVIHVGSEGVFTHETVIVALILNAINIVFAIKFDSDVSVGQIILSLIVG